MLNRHGHPEVFGLSDYARADPIRNNINKGIGITGGFHERLSWMLTMLRRHHDVTLPDGTDRWNLAPRLFDVLGGFDEDGEDARQALATDLRFGPRPIQKAVPA
jgi:hypothetical protein